MKYLILILMATSLNLGAQTSAELLEAFSKRTVISKSIATTVYTGSMKNRTIEQKVNRVLDAANWSFGDNLISKIKGVHKNYVDGSVEFGNTGVNGYIKINVPLKMWGVVPLYFKDKGSGVEIKAIITILEN